MTTPPSFNLAGLDAALTWIRRDPSQRRSDRDAATIGSWESGIDPDLYADFPGPVGDLLRDKSLAEASLGFVDPLVTMRLRRPYFLACGVRPRSRTGPARSTGMSNHVRVPAGVREGGQFRARARSEGSGLGALVCVECGGNLVVESDGVPAHVGLDGEPFTTDHDYRDRDELPDYGGATAFPDADVDETPPPVKDDYERDPEPLDYEFQLSAAGLDYVTDNGDVTVGVERDQDGRPVRLRRGKVVFEVPVIGTEQGHYGPVPIGSRRGDGRRPVAEVAALARQDIKDAIAVGWLPSNLTYRVKTRHGSSVNVDIEGVNDADRVDPWKARVAEEHGAYRRTDRDEFIELERRVDRIVKQYGRFEIDSMTDYFHVDYYSNVRIPDEASQAWWAKERERMAARRRANSSRKAAG